MPQLFARLGVAGGLLIVAGGLLYTAGAAIYAHAPDPVPAVFGTTRSSTCWSSPGSPRTSWPSACSLCRPAARARASIASLPRTRVARGHRSGRRGSALGLGLEVRQDAADPLVQGLAAVALEQTGDQAFPGLLRTRHGAVAGSELEHAARP